MSNYNSYDGNSYGGYGGGDTGGGYMTNSYGGGDTNGDVKYSSQGGADRTVRFQFLDVIFSYGFRLMFNLIRFLKERQGFDQ